MSSKQIAFVSSQAVFLCTAAGVVTAAAAAVAAPDALIPLAGKVANRVLENVLWLVQLPTNRAEEFFLPYLLLSLALALFVVGRDARAPLGWRDLLARIFPRAIYTHRSARVDYALVLTDRVFTPAVLGTRLLSTAALAGWISGQLDTLLGARPPLLSAPAAALAFTLLFALGSDLADYLQHRLHHSSRLLWQFHRLHHSAEVMTPLTIFRVHPVEQVLGATVTTLVVGCITGVSSHWLMDSPKPITFLGTQLLMFLLYTCCAVHLRHSHVWLSWPPALSHFLISPAQHQIHHSAAVRHWDRNYGNVLAIWDWMFGSLYVPKEREELTFGLAEGQPHPTLIDAYLEPPMAVARLLAKRLRRGAQTLRALSRRRASAAEEAWHLDLPLILRDERYGDDAAGGVRVTLDSRGAQRLLRLEEIGTGRRAAAGSVPPGR